MSKKGNQIARMANEVIVSGHHIVCNKCHKHDEISAYDEYDAAEYYYEKGWRVPKLLTYCPKCAKKHLKK